MKYTEERLYGFTIKAHNLMSPYYYLHPFQHREGSAWVILVNLIFGLLTMFHLAYLGVMFDQSSPEQVNDTSSKKHQLYFFTGDRLQLVAHSGQMEKAGLH